MGVMYVYADSWERLHRLWILLQFTDMTLSLFAICLRFPASVWGMRPHWVRVETVVEN